MTNNEVKLNLITFIFLNFGKNFTFDKLAENVAELDRMQAYAILDELANTGHVLRGIKTRSNGKKIFEWGIDDSDEIHALEIWTKYLRDAV